MENLTVATFIDTFGLRGNFLIETASRFLATPMWSYKDETYADYLYACYLHFRDQELDETILYCTLYYVCAYLHNRQFTLDQFNKLCEIFDMDGLTEEYYNDLIEIMYEAEPRIFEARAHILRIPLMQRYTVPLKILQCLVEHGEERSN